jgi:hypothetical protein
VLRPRRTPSGGLCFAFTKHVCHGRRLDNLVVSIPREIVEDDPLQVLLLGTITLLSFNLLGGA